MYALNIYRRELPNGTLTTLKTFSCPRLPEDSATIHKLRREQDLRKLTCDNLVELTRAGSQQSVKVQGLVYHVQGRSDGLTGILVSDPDFSHQLAHKFLNHILADVNGTLDWKTVSSLESYNMDRALDMYLEKYQIPAEVDALAALKEELDEAEREIVDLLEARREQKKKIEHVVRLTEDLRLEAKHYCRQSTKHSSTCF